jgi:hypothetical protein
MSTINGIYAKSTRRRLACAVLAAALLGPVSADAQGASALPAAGSATPARLIDAPSERAVIRKAPVRVAVRRSAGAKLTIRLGRRDVTSRFRAKGGALVARLTTGDGVRYGRNHLFVLSERSGRRAQSHGRSFFLVRRRAGLVRLKLGAGPPLKAQVDIPGRRKATLAWARRAFTKRVWLNGRRVERFASSSQGTRLSFALSATHGLRYGKNTLRVSVVDPLAGRYDQVKRRFVVRRTAPLASAGRDRAATPRRRLRLGGTALAAKGGVLRYRWTLVRKPRGSRTQISGRTSARPRLIPDRPGLYVARQVVTERRRTARGARTAQVRTTAVDDVRVAATPQSTLVQISADTTGPKPSITVGETNYPLTSNPALGRMIQWLTLDRSTLQPVQTGNTWCCNESNDLDRLTNQLKCDGSVGQSGRDQLMIIALPPNRQTLDSPEEYAAFNQALQALGADPLPDALLNDASQSPVIVGVPCGGSGSGWVKLLGSRGGPFQLGWLMPDGTKELGTGALHYRFQPERLAFDTNVEVNATTSRMTFNGQNADATIAPGQVGFHVVEIDPRDFSVAGSDVFVTNNGPNPDGGIADMAAKLRATREKGFYAAIQNVGFVQTASDSGFAAVADAIAALGGNPDTFYRVAGSYAFFGGPPLTRGEVLQSSSANVIDPTKKEPTIETGTLSGRARIGHDGYYVPALPAGADAPGSSLYDIIFSPATPWPYTFGAPADVAAYKAAMAYITANLDSLSAYKPDLRQAYLANTGIKYSDSRGDLRAIAYPGDNRTCGRNPGKAVAPDPGYTRTQFCNLVTELLLEFEWLDNTRALMDQYKEALGMSGGTQGLDLRTIGENLKNSIPPPPNLEVVAPILDLLEAVAEAGIAVFGGPEGVPIALALAAAMTDIGTVGATDSDGKPLGDTVSAKVDDLAADIGANITNGSSALDGVRAVAISDYGRLKALSALWTTVGGATVTDLSTQLTIGAQGYFSTTLVPLVYDVWRLPEGANVFTCIPGGHIDPPFEKAPASSWVNFLEDFKVQGGTRLSRVRLLNVKGAEAGNYPAATVTDPMFLPVSQNGFGLNQSTWFWARGDSAFDETCGG